MYQLWNWLLNVTGTNNSFNQTSTKWYNFHSGFGSSLESAALTLLGAYVMYWWHTRCHLDRCFRKGKHDFHHYKLCKKHHPKVPEKVTHLHIMQLHKQTTKTK